LKIPGSSFSSFLVRYTSTSFPVNLWGNVMGASEVYGQWLAALLDENLFVILCS
jgi:hypothetical protein